MNTISTYFIPLIILILWSCDGTKTAKEKEVISEQNEQIESINTETEAAKNDLQTIVKALEKESKIELPKAYYAALGLEDEDTHYLLIPTKKTDDFDFFVISRQLPPTPILSPYELTFFITHIGEVKQKQSIEIGIHSELNATMLHEHIVCIKDLVSNFEENEDGIMEEMGEPFEKLRFVSILNGQVKLINQLTKDELRIARNYIFARYGRKFQSVDLQEYFAQFDWYKAMSKNVDEQLTDLDKELLKQLVAIENGQP